MKVQFEAMFPWELAQAIAHAPICYLPLGVLEWHGEHNVVGLDAIKAYAICVRAAQQSGGVVAPPLYWASDSREDLDDGSYLTGGVEHGKRYHVPGNMFWIRPETFQNLLSDIYEAMWRRGFRVIVTVSGHWSKNLPVIQASGTEFLAQHPEMKWLLLTDQELVPDLHYPHEHAAGGETSLLMAIQPDWVDLSKTLETCGALKAHYAGQPHGRATLPWGWLAFDNAAHLFSWEFLFRGFLLFGLARRYGNDAIFLQAIPFAIAHFGKCASQ